MNETKEWENVGKSGEYDLVYVLTHLANRWFVMVSDGASIVVSNVSDGDS